MQARGLPVGDPGLERVLGGGLKFFSRAPELPPSAVLLVRGGPGTGKSTLAAQVAAAAARELGGDVLYGCVEIFPQETKEQLGAFAWARDGVRLETLDAVTNEQTAAEGRPWLVPALLDATPGEDEQRRDLALALETQFNNAVAKGLVPRVLVIDSLTDGYKLGATVPRAYADAVCKLFAQLGVLGVLIEEVVGPEPTPWTFAVDTVLDLGRERSGEGDEWVRTLTVSKHRFAASHPGPHVVTVSSTDVEAGVRVAPSLSTYDVFPFWSGMTKPARDPVEHLRWLPESWKLYSPAVSGERPRPLSDDFPSPKRGVALVFGENPTHVSRIADALCAQNTTGAIAGFDCVISLDERVVPHPAEALGAPQFRAPAPTRAPEQWLAETVEKVRRTWRKQSADGVRRFVIGDLRALDAFADPRRWRRTVLTLVRLLSTLDVPVIAYETSPASFRWQRTQVRGVTATGIPAPDVSVLSNLVVEVVEDFNDTLAPPRLLFRWRDREGVARNLLTSESVQLS